MCRHFMVEGAPPQLRRWSFARPTPRLAARPSCRPAADHPPRRALPARRRAVMAKKRAHRQLYRRDLHEPATATQAHVLLPDAGADDNDHPLPGDGAPTAPTPSTRAYREGVDPRSAAPGGCSPTAPRPAALPRRSTWSGRSRARRAASKVRSTGHGRSRPVDDDHSRRSRRSPPIAGSIRKGCGGQCHRPAGQPRRAAAPAWRRVESVTLLSALASAPACRARPIAWPAPGSPRIEGAPRHHRRRATPKYHFIANTFSARRRSLVGFRFL